MVERLIRSLPLYVDEDLGRPLGHSLRVAGYDAVNTLEAGNAGRIDPLQLAYAAQHGRVLLTANYADFRMLHEAWLIWADLWGETAYRRHPGVLVPPNPNTTTVATMTGLIDEFVRDLQSGDLEGRFFRWRTTTGWRDLSAIR